MPACHRSALFASSRARSYSSDPNACTSRIAPSTSPLIEAISPSRLRICLEETRARLRNQKLSNAITGVTAKAQSASTGSMYTLAPSISRKMRNEDTSAPSEPAKMSPMALTSPVTRVTRSPVCSRAWNEIERRCSCE